MHTSKLIPALAILSAGVSAYAQFPDLAPPTPLLGAVLMGDTAKVKQLLKAGANPNEGRFFGMPAVVLPLMMQNRDMFSALVTAGADLRVRDDTGATTLMWAAYNGNGDAAFVEPILKAGVDVNARDKKGDTALDWAMRRGATPMVAILERAGASRDPLIRQSVQKALSLLLESGPQFFKVSGCVSCHHQNLPSMAVALAAPRGIPVDATLADRAVKTTIATWKPMREQMLAGTAPVPNPPVVVSYSLVALADAKYPADETTAAMVKFITQFQGEDGAWRSGIRRPPIESSDFTATALSLRALQLYGGDQARVARGASWLAKQAPQDNEDRVMQLLAMAWTRSDRAAIQARSRELLAEQRPDGGWAQLPGLESDSYATGEALYALHTAGALAPADRAYQTGVAFLLRTQLADGSWLVRSRSFPVQPYKESGFPHGRNQWISAAGTGWAAIALSLAAGSAGFSR